MRKFPSQRSRAVSARSAFTLIELLIVISIIATIIAMLAPALQSVFHKVKIAQVRAEITGLSNSADNFYGVHGVYPPSYIKLFEKGGTWSNESKRAIRRIWDDQFNFGIDRDIDGKNGVKGSHTLDGDECLVFFLGGIARKDSSGLWALNGFSRNKANPFKLGGKNRAKYFTEWDNSRLGDRDGDGFPEYSDIFNDPTLRRPYVYFSTTRTGSYDAGDIPGMTSVYWQGSSSTPWKDKAIQIISPGFDHKYGTGGPYTQEDGLIGSGRLPEEDNITNFAGGALGK